MESFFFFFFVSCVVAPCSKSGSSKASLTPQAAAVMNVEVCCDQTGALSCGQKLLLHFFKLRPLTSLRTFRTNLTSHRKASP